MVEGSCGGSGSGMTLPGSAQKMEESTAATAPFVTSFPRNTHPSQKMMMMQCN